MSGGMVAGVPAADMPAGRIPARVRVQRASSKPAGAWPSRGHTICRRMRVASMPGGGARPASLAMACALRRRHGSRVWPRSRCAAMGLSGRKRHHPTCPRACTAPLIGDRRRAPDFQEPRSTPQASARVGTGSWHVQDVRGHARGHGTAMHGRTFRQNPNGKHGAAASSKTRSPCPPFLPSMATRILDPRGIRGTPRIPRVPCGRPGGQRDAGLVDSMNWATSPCSFSSDGTWA